MKRFILCIFSILLVQTLLAQEPVKPALPEMDTTRLETPGLYEPRLVLPDVNEEIPEMMNLKTKLEVPAFDFSKYLNSRWRVDYSTFNGQNYLPGNIPNIQTGSFFSPFYGSGTIFNQAVYQLSGKLMVGGNSFGANSIYGAPFNRSGTGPYDMHGASLFLEYKVSRNFRIGGSISVSNNPYQP
jgi:hypothetical protein